MSVDEVAEALNNAIVEMGDGTEALEEQQEEQAEDTHLPTEAEGDSIPTLEGHADESSATEGDSREESAPPSTLPEGLEWASDFNLEDDDTVAAINFWANRTDDKRFHMTVPEMREKHGDEFAEKYKSVQSAYSKHKNANREQVNGVPDDWVQRKLRDFYEKDQMPQQPAAPAPAVPAKPESIVDNSALEQMKAAAENGDWDSVGSSLASIVGNAVSAAKAEAKAEALDIVRTQSANTLKEKIDEIDARMHEQEGERYGRYREPSDAYNGKCAIQWVMDNVSMNPWSGERIDGSRPDAAYRFLLQGEQYNGEPVISGRPSAGAQPPAASSGGAVPDVTEGERRMGWEERIRHEFRKKNIIA